MNEDIKAQVVASAGLGLVEWLMTPILEAGDRPVLISMKSTSAITHCLLLAALGMIDEEDNFEEWNEAEAVMETVLELAVKECAELLNMSKTEWFKKYIVWEEDEEEEE